ncbi:hypothetical protein [Pseudooceanicola sp.]|uniref:hypothetical protein n=1 Tax=Pseudooceanicola sp. TaxID=1914328 RepID=UPI0040593EB5
MIRPFVGRHIWPLVAGGVTLALIAAAVIWLRHDAAEDVRNEIEEQNNEAGDAGDAAARDRRECVRSGGVWRFESGECARSR